MKRIITLGLFILTAGILYSQTPVVGPENNWAGTGTTLGIFTKNPVSGNTWTRVIVGAQGNVARVSKFTVGGAGATTLSLSSNVITTGYTNISVSFKEWISSGFPISQVSLDYSLNGGTSWTSTGFVSSATTSIPTSNNASVLLPVTAENISTLKVRFSFTGTTYNGTANYNIDDFVITGTPPPAVYFNNNGSDLSDVASWGTNPDGSGASPTDFDTDAQTFNINNGSSATILGDWIVSGVGSSIILGNGTNPITFTVPDGLGFYAESFDIANNAVLDNSSGADLPPFGTIDAGSTVIYSNVADQTVSEATYGNLTLSGSGIKTLPAGTTVTIAGTFNTGTGLSVILGNTFNSQLVINGVVTGTSAILGSNESQIMINKTGGGNVGTLYFNPAGTLYKLMVLSGDVTLGSNLSLGGILASIPELSIAENASLNASNFTIFGSALTESIDIKGKFITANLNGFSKGTNTALASSLTTPGIDSVSSTIEYNATAGTQTITPRPKVEAYNNLILSGNSTKLFNDITDGYTIKGDFTKTGGAALITTAKSFEFEGYKDQIIAGLTYPIANFSGSGIKTLSSVDSTVITTSMTISGSASIITNNKLVIKYSNGSTGNLLDLTSGGISGNVNVEVGVPSTRTGSFISSGPPVYVSSPVSTTLNSFQPTNINFFQYVPTLTPSKYQRVTVTDAAVTGRGYLLRAFPNKIFHLNGSVTNADITSTLIYGGDNYNLIGNPYPATVVWNAPAIVMTNVTANRYLYYTGTGFQTVFSGPTSRIGVGQGFFVEASGAGASVRFTKAALSVEKEAIKRIESLYSNIVECRIYKGSNSDGSFVWGQEEGNVNVYNSKIDGTKLFPNEGIPAVYFEKGEKKLDVFSFSNTLDKSIIPVKLLIPSDTVYSLLFNEIQNVDPAYQIYLHDNTLNSFHDLRLNNTYKFSSTIASQARNRFELVFSKSIITSLDATDNNNSSFAVFSENGNAYFNMESLPESLVITDISGNKIYESGNIQNKNLTVDLSSNPKSVYIASFISEEKITHKKFILNK